jgi:hypothetical protein
MVKNTAAYPGRLCFFTPFIPGTACKTRLYFRFIGGLQGSPGQLFQGVFKENCVYFQYLSEFRELWISKIYILHRKEFNAGYPEK